MKENLETIYSQLKFDQTNALVISLFNRTDQLIEYIEGLEAFYIIMDYKMALNHLQHALSYTLNLDDIFTINRFTTEELYIISAISSVYIHIRNYRLAQKYNDLIIQKYNQTFNSNTLLIFDSLYYKALISFINKDYKEAYQVSFSTLILMNQNLVNCNLSRLLLVLEISSWFIYSYFEPEQLEFIIRLIYLENF